MGNTAQFVFSALEERRTQYQSNVRRILDLCWLGLDLRHQLQKTWHTDGGSLFIGVDNDCKAIGLEHDCAVVKPPTVDGLVNWLATHLINALKHPTVMRTRTRIEPLDDQQICRVDIARSSVPVRAKMGDKEAVFWIRVANTTRALPPAEVDEYQADHWR